MNIGPLVFDTPVVLAPMAGVTNAPFRRLCRRHGAGLYVSEMITARAYVEGKAKTMRLAHFDEDEPIRSIQLYGIDAHHVGEAVRKLIDSSHVDHIDLNFGCPAPKVTRNGGGSALPVRHRLLRDIVRAAVQATGSSGVPVTAKFRMGIDDGHLNFLRTGRICEDEGCSAVALHARTTEQLYSGDARWDAIGELKASITSIPVLGNGDIWEAADAVAMMRRTGCDGVVIGRGCLGRPWLFRDLAAALGGSPIPEAPTFGEVVDMMLEHLDLLIDWAGQWIGVREFRKHTGWYLKGYATGGDVRRELNQLESREQLADTLGRFDRSSTMSSEGRRAKRGHVGGPRAVSLPDRWFDNEDAIDALAADAESISSGG